VSANAASAQGTVAPGFEQVAEEFERNLAERGEVGAAFAAYVDGELVVDLWGGLADRQRGIAWRDDTLVGVFSGSKGLVAACLLVLIERGLLELDVPVCRYWPEFAAQGKEGILVRDVVSHRAGLPGLLTAVSLEEATDDVRMAQLVAAQARVVAPEAGARYHAVTFGWLCGELVRRVDGRSVGRFLREEIADRQEAPPHGRKWKVAVCGPQRPAQVALGPDFTIGWDSHAADFAMTLGEFYCKGLTAPVMVEIKRDDVVFARVYDIRGRSISSLLAIPAP